MTIDYLRNRLDVFYSSVILKTPIKISVANEGAFITATRKGNIDLTTNLGILGTLEDVLYAPELPYNLLAVRKIQQAGMTVTLFGKSGGIEMKRDGKVVIKGTHLSF